MAKTKESEKDVFRPANDLVAGGPIGDRPHQHGNIPGDHVRRYRTLALLPNI